MDIDKVISIIRYLREEGMVTGSSSGTPGFSEKSPAEGPTAGITPVLGKMRRRNTYATGGTGSRKKWLDYLKRKT
jgi:hypothetical protein